MADPGLKILLNKLGETINQVLTESPEVKSAIQEVRETGYEVSLTVEATAIGSGPKATSLEVHSVSPKKVNFRLTPEDAKFLKQLKISLDDYILE